MPKVIFELGAWTSDLRGFGLTGSGLTRVHCTGIHSLIEVVAGTASPYRLMLSRKKPSGWVLSAHISEGKCTEEAIPFILQSNLSR